MPEGADRTPRRALLRPLSPTTFLWRNAGKTIPLTGVITLAVMLVAGIIALINSIPYSIRTIYSYSEEMLAVGPRGDVALTPKLVKTVKEETPVPLERVVMCRATGAAVESIVGNWPFVVVGIGQQDMDYFVRRMGARTIDGRLPKPDQPEAIVSAPVAKNLGLKIGDALLKPDDNDRFSPYKVKVVGIADTARWFMVTDIGYLRANHFPPVDLAMFFARNREDQDKLGHWAEKRFKGERAQIFAYHQIDKQTEDMFKTLYKILDVVIATLVLVITFMMGMLMNIYQSQRLIEFGLLQAIGYTRKALLRRVVLESLLVVAVGWALGVVLAFGMLNIVKVVLMDPRAFALDTMDLGAFRYTIPLPFAILFVAMATVMLRFRKFDPVGVVERRLV